MLESSVLESSVLGSSVLGSSLLGSSVLGVSVLGGLVVELLLPLPDGLFNLGIDSVYVSPHPSLLQV